MIFRSIENIGRFLTSIARCRLLYFLLFAKTIIVKILLENLRDMHEPFHIYIITTEHIVNRLAMQIQNGGKFHNGDSPLFHNLANLFSYVNLRSQVCE